MTCLASLVDSCAIPQTDNSVNMIRHDNETIEVDMRVVLGESMPTRVDHRSESVQLHPSVDDSAE